MDDLTAPVIAIALLLIVLATRAFAQRHRRVQEKHQVAECAEEAAPAPGEAA